MRIATAEWANPAEVEERYLYRDGMVWLGRSASEHQVPLGYKDDRHVCLVGRIEGGKGTTAIVPVLITLAPSRSAFWTQRERTPPSQHRAGEGARSTPGEWARPSRFSIRSSRPRWTIPSGAPSSTRLDAFDPGHEETIDEAGRLADAIVVIHEGGTNDPFWDESARAMVKGLLLHVLTAPQYEGRRSLSANSSCAATGKQRRPGGSRAAGDKTRRRMGCCGWGWSIIKPSTG